MCIIIISKFIEQISGRFFFISFRVIKRVILVDKDNVLLFEMLYDRKMREYVKRKEK